MKAWKWIEPLRMQLVDLPRPVPQAHEALVRVEAVGVCGSDIHYYRDGGIGNNVLREPTVLGHEYAGVVEAVGAAADARLVGRRVAVEPGIPCGVCEWCLKGRYNLCQQLFFPGGPGHDGALCDYMCVDARFCYPVDETLSAGAAAMVEPAAVAVHSVELARMRPGDTVAIFGLGVIGLLTGQMARACGASRVLGIDVLGYRVDLAAAHGADAGFLSAPGGHRDGGAAAVAWVLEQTAGRGVDVAFDCTNSSDGLALACAVTRPGGTCVLTGISGKDEDTLPVGLARRHELTMQWCRRFVHNYPAALALIATGKLDVTSLVTHVFPFEETQQAFDLTMGYDDGVIKASIEW